MRIAMFLSELQHLLKVIEREMRRRLGSKSLKNTKDGGDGVGQVMHDDINVLCIRSGYETDRGIMSTPQR